MPPSPLGSNSSASSCITETPKALPGLHHPSSLQLPNPTEPSGNHMYSMYVYIHLYLHVTLHNITICNIFVYVCTHTCVCLCTFYILSIYELNIVSYLYVPTYTCIKTQLLRSFCCSSNSMYMHMSGN